LLGKQNEWNHDTSNEFALPLWSYVLFIPLSSSTVICTTKSQTSLCSDGNEIIVESEDPNFEDWCELLHSLTTHIDVDVTNKSSSRPSAPSPQSPMNSPPFAFSLPRDLYQIKNHTVLHWIDASCGRLHTSNTIKSLRSLTVLFCKGAVNQLVQRGYGALANTRLQFSPDLPLGSLSSPHVVHVNDLLNVCADAAALCAPPTFELAAIRLFDVALFPSLTSKLSLLLTSHTVPSMPLLPFLCYYLTEENIMEIIWELYSPLFYRELEIRNVMSSISRTAMCSGLKGISYFPQFKTHIYRTVARSALSTLFEEMKQVEVDYRTGGDMGKWGFTDEEKQQLCKIRNLEKTPRYFLPT
jgi:hypothetical protein